MSVRQIYETAFDSAVKVPDADYLDDLAQSPLICGPVSNFMQDAKSQSAKQISNCPSSKCISHRSDRCSVFERRTENERDRNFKQYSRSPGCRKFRNTSRVPEFLLSKPNPTHEKNACNGFPADESQQTSTSVKESLPSRPHSDPLDRRKAESSLRPIAEHTSRSNPVFHLPLEQSAPCDANASKTFSPSTEFKKLKVGERTVAEVMSLNSVSAEFAVEYPVQMHTRDLVVKVNSCRTLAPHKDHTKDPSELKHRDTRIGRDEIKRNHSEMMSAARQKLNLDLNQPSKRPRRHFLNFWTPGHDAFQDIVDPSVELEKQGWYHGSINHTDAENALRLLKEGSFLVRCCKTSQQNYSLSIKSASGVMHMKISRSGSGRYVLKHQSQSFDSIPEMVHHFSMHPLPVYGLEHVMLKSPVISQLL